MDEAIYREKLSKSLRHVFDSRDLPLYGMMSYHFGFHESEIEFSPDYLHGVSLLLVSEFFGSSPDVAMSAAVALELINGFCEIHDDVQSGRPSRSGRDSLWWVWGPAQAINAGDGMHALARMELLLLPEKGFPSELSYQAIKLLDQATLKSCEGRFRDLDMQEKLDVSVAAYTKMASEKSVYLLCGVEKVRFKKKVMPGDTLRFETKLLANKRKIWKFDSKAFRGSEMVCSAEILCADGSLNE